MTIDTNRSRFVPVLAAAALVLILAGLFAVRLMARQPTAAPALSGWVPPPTQVELAAVGVPCWACREAREWPLRFRTDLDLLAPLGTGTVNAAEWFALFEKQRGQRYGDAKAFMERRAEVPELADFGEVVAGDDPLLLEAEPWCDQAVMDFYPEIFPLEGIDTRITNLLVPLAMARSWAVRGVLAADPEQGLEDCRRAIRVGRLLRQEDAVVITDLVGLACIRDGARGMYRIAQRMGDHELALIASVVLGEVAPQRLFTAQRITSVDMGPFMRRAGDGSFSLELPETRLEALIQMLTSCPDLRFKGEALFGAHVVAHLGTPAQQQRMGQVLDGIASGDDEGFASFARWSRDTEPSTELLTDIMSNR